MTGSCQDLKMMIIMTDLHFTESISYVDWCGGGRPTPAASTNKLFIILYLRRNYIEKTKIESANKSSVISYMAVWIFNSDPPPSQKVGMRCGSANNPFILINIY